jgi:hypothetical protein
MIQIVEQKASKTPSSEIFAVTGTKGNDKGIEQLIDLMGEGKLKFYRSSKKSNRSSNEGLIAMDDTVLIKINCQWDERGGTNTDVINTLIGVVLDHPDGFKGEIIVADNGQAQYGATRLGGSLDYRNNNAQDKTQSIKRVIERYVLKGAKVSGYLWDTITENVVSEYIDGDDNDGYVVSTRVNPLTGVITSYPKFKTTFGTRISFRHGIWNPKTAGYDVDQLKVLNVPVLKSHFIFGVTGAVKHYMGIPSDKLTARLGYQTHPTVGKGGMGTLMATTRFPTLNILDAIYINAHPGKGPGTPYDAATETNIIAASIDPIALDYWASKNILCKTAKNIHNEDPTFIDPDNIAEKSFGSWLRLASGELSAAGFNVTYDPTHINVRVRI